MNTCPCGSGKLLSDCCGPVLSGTPASTPEALMRSRYSAYVLGNMDHLDSSLAPESRQSHDRNAAELWSKSVQWLGLAILATQGGGTNDAEGVVEFTARYRQNGIEQTHHETSRFRRDPLAGWLYVDGKQHLHPVVRTGPKVGRNDPCTCGSGKKFKQCCGKN